MSEISTYISSGPLTPTRPGSPGKAQPGRRIAILREESESTEQCPPGEAGLLAVHRNDPGLMLGYWNRPEEEAKVFRGEWFAGGDRAIIDADGYVQYLGREDDLMNTSGYRVSPVEVESALAAFPGINEVAVCEINPAPGIQLIAAFIVPVDPAFIDDALRIEHEKNAIFAFAAERLAAYKRPREIYFRTTLPRTANGKVVRNKLRAD